MDENSQQQQPPREPPAADSSDNDPSASVGGKCFRFFFRSDDSEPITILKMRTVESSFAPASKSWGRAVLFAWRLVLAFYTLIGVITEWIEDWGRGEIYPPVYIVNWGSVAVAVYYTVAMVNSGHSLGIHSETQLISRCWRWLIAFQIILFDLALVLETLIMIFYRSFQLEGLCTLDCSTASTLEAGALFIELMFSRMPIRMRHGFLTILYPILWILSQIAWVYTDHPPAYPRFLTFRDRGSVMVFVGLVFFCNVQLVFRLIAEARDIICQGRFYPADEGKELGTPLGESPTPPRSPVEASGV